jgi:hypothetical protein
VNAPTLSLWALLFLFVLRVAGQLFVFLGVASWLPPMEKWHSDLVPYGVLLAAQIAIIVAYAKAAADVTRGRGSFASPRPGLGRGLTIFGCVYLAAMIVRFVIQGPTIPVFFHWVLAAFLLVLGRHHRRGIPAT